VHASKKSPVHTSSYFVGRDIHSHKVAWGQISMVDAERRLLAHALVDPDNQHFILLSDSCVPLFDFNYIYNHLIFANLSFIDCFEDPGPHGSGRYSQHMLPEVEKKDFRKGSQVCVNALCDKISYFPLSSSCKMFILEVCRRDLQFRKKQWSMLLLYSSMLPFVSPCYLNHPSLCFSFLIMMAEFLFPLVLYNLDMFPCVFIIIFFSGFQ
jgi:hypothetical protein